MGSGRKSPIHLRRPDNPEQLLAWNRGHCIENGNHCSKIRARHAPANNATLNNIALAIGGFRHLPEANLHFLMRPLEALDAILSPS